MDTPNISSGLPVNPSLDKPRIDSSPAQNTPVKDVQKVEKIDPVKAVEDLSRAVDILNEALARDPVALRFSVDETLKRPIVTVVSEETGEIVHQLPAEEVMRAVRNIDKMRGILFEGFS